MAWHKITDRKTGEVIEMVASLDGIDLEGREAEPLSRAPHAYEELADGRLRDHRTRERRMPSNRKELEELIRSIVAEALKDN